MLLKVITEGSFNGSAFFVNGGLGANFFLSMTDISPYLAADFGAGAAKIDGGTVLVGQTVGGFVVGIGGGIQVFRTSATNLDLGFRAGFMLKSNDLGAPQVLTFRLGLYF